MIGIDTLLNSLGGNTAVGLAIGKGQTTVSEMKRRRSIPVRYWPRLIELARERDVQLSVADLVRIHSSSPAEERAP